MAAESPRNNAVLIVDDDRNILGALKRLFRKLDDTEVYTADSPEEGLQVLAERAIDLLISDERMPGMQGHELVQQVKEHYPDTLRIILTGYSDLDAMRLAVNKGEIYRFLEKPWDDADLLLTVRNALRYARSERERRSLVQQLEALNRNLEAKVERRTADLRKAMRYIEQKRRETASTLNNAMTFLSSVASLIDAETERRSFLAQTVDLAERVAAELSLEEGDVQLVTMACHILGIGAVAGGNSQNDCMLSDGTMNAGTIETAEHLVESVLHFDELSNIVRHIGENIDGSGEPDHLSGEDIPIQSRIVRAAMALEYQRTLSGRSIHSALDHLRRSETTIFDRRIVRAIETLLREESVETAHRVAIADLSPGMTLGEDIVLETGFVFIAKGTSLTRKMVFRIQERIHQEAFPIDPARTVLVERPETPTAEE